MAFLFWFGKVTLMCPLLSDPSVVTVVPIQVQTEPPGELSLGGDAELCQKAMSRGSRFGKSWISARSGPALAISCLLPQGPVRFGFPSPTLPGEYVHPGCVAQALSKRTLALEWETRIQIPAPLSLYWLCDLGLLFNLSDLAFPSLGLPLTHRRKQTSSDCGKD